VKYPLFRSRAFEELMSLEMGSSTPSPFCPQHSTPAPLVPRVGVDFSLEEIANQILADGRKGITKLSDKKDYFTEEQLVLRQQREVYNSNGFPDKGIVCGLYRRTYNPNMGKRPTSGPKSSDTVDYGGSVLLPEWT
jgi:hypothetical protein